MARTMEGLLLAQPYVKGVTFDHYYDMPTADCDLQQAEGDHNPEAFPECTEEEWPGNRNIAKRYATHFGLTWRPGEKWLTAPATKSVDVVLHYMERRGVRSFHDWCVIVQILCSRGLSFRLYGDNEHRDFLETADWINSAKCFLGTVSSCNAIAEGLGKRRLVEHAPGCWNVTADIVINDMSNEQVVAEVMRICGK